MSPACSSVTGCRVFPIGELRCASRSSPLDAAVGQMVVVLDHAGANLEVGHAPGKRVGHGLEDDGGGWFLLSDGALHFVAVEGAL